MQFKQFALTYTVALEASIQHLSLGHCRNPRSLIKNTRFTKILHYCELISTNSHFFNNFGTYDDSQAAWCIAIGMLHNHKPKRGLNQHQSPGIKPLFGSFLSSIQNSACLTAPSSNATSFGSRFPIQGSSNSDNRQHSTATLITTRVHCPTAKGKSG